MKIKWVEYYKGKWPKWFLATLPIKDERVWYMNINERDVTKIIKAKEGINMPLQVLKAWAKYNFQDPEEEQEIAEQLIWGNSLIRRQNKPILDKKIVNSKIETIEDLANKEAKRLKSYQEVVNDYEVTFDQLFYEGIKAAIPRSWIAVIKYKENQQNQEKSYKYDQVKPGVVKKVYWKLVERKKPKDGCKIMWEKDLGREIETEEWNRLYRHICTITNSTKLRIFQYKLLNRLITTNVTVAKWQQTSENCTFCKSKKESVIHLFCKSEETVKLWNKMERWLKYFKIKSLKHEKSEIILNNYKEKQSKFVNTIILCFKRFVYVKRCQQESLNFSEFMTEISNPCKIEKIIASRNDKLKIYYKKWGEFLKI